MNYKKQLDIANVIGLSVHDLNVAIEVERLGLGGKDFESVCSYVSGYDLKSSESILMEIVDSVEFALERGVKLENILDNHWDELNKLSAEESESDYFDRIFTEVQTSKGENSFWRINTTDSRDCTMNEVEWFWGTDKQAQDYASECWEGYVTSGVENYDIDNYDWESNCECEDDCDCEKDVDWDIVQHEVEEAITSWAEFADEFDDISDYLCGYSLVESFKQDIEEKALELGIIETAFKEYY